MNVNIRKVSGLTITVKATITREFRLRMWLATALIRMAGAVLGGRADIDVDVVPGGSRWRS